MTDPILRKMRAETSAACLMALRTWAIGDDKWSEDAHQPVYAKRLTELEGRWK